MKLLHVPSCEYFQLVCNPHRLERKSVQDYLTDLDALNSQPDWASAEDREIAERSGEMWAAHYYPKNMTGFYAFAAPTLDKLNALIMRQEQEGTY